MQRVTESMAARAAILQLMPLSVREPVPQRRSMKPGATTRRGA